MKFLKIAGIFLAVVVAAISIIGFTGPKTYDVNRSATINAPIDVVFTAISHFKNFQQWSPWAELDTAMKTNLEGTDGSVGAKYSWDGNDQVGAGYMQLTKVDQLTGIEQELMFLKPFKSSASVYMNTEAIAGGTKVTWGMKGDMDFMARVFGFFMGGMDGMIGKDYEKGLAKLKTLCESGGVTTKGYDVVETNWVEKKCLSIRQTIGFSDFAKFFGEHYPKMAEAISKAGAKPGIPLGVYYVYDEAGMKADVAASIPYEGNDIKAEGYTKLSLPAAKAYLIDYYGNYEKMKPAYDALGEKLKAIGKGNPDLIVEEYITDPMTEPDTAKWHTKIYFFVK